MSEIVFRKKKQGCNEPFYSGQVLQYRANVSWQSRLETRFSILEAIEDRVSSFETLEEFFEDLDGSFRGND